METSSIHRGTTQEMNNLTNMIENDIFIIDEVNPVVVYKYVSGSWTEMSGDWISDKSIIITGLSLQVSSVDTGSF